MPYRWWIVSWRSGFGIFRTSYRVITSSLLALEASVFTISTRHSPDSPTPVLPLDDIAMHRSKFVVEWLRVMIVDQHEPFARSEAIERIEQHLVSPLRYQVTHVERPQLPVTERFLFRYPGLARFGVRILVGPVEGTVSFDLILDQKSVDISIGNNENFGICLGLVERVVDPFWNS